MHLTPEKEALLHALASRAGKDTSQLMEEAVDQLLADDAQVSAAAREGFAAIDRGEYLDEEEMDARVARLLQR